MGRSGLRDKARRHDPSYRRAKRENFAGRAVYKLQELDQKFRLFRKGQAVLELGCWPGSWTQYAAERIGEEGRIVGVDLKEVEHSLPKNTTLLVGDVWKLRPDAMSRRYGPFSLVISDMAPNTTGEPDGDVYRCEELCLRAIEIAVAAGRPGSHFCAKIFQGERFTEILKGLGERYQQARAYRCKTTRTGSREQYLVAKGLRASVAGQTLELCAPRDDDNDADA